MAMYWTNERLSELIAQFRTHPVLWNPKHENYRDRLSKSRAWDDIASNLRVERYVCERKMNILRTQFRREWNRKKYSLMNGKIVRESKWYAYRSLQFLEGVEQRGFRHRFSNQAENFHNIASVLQISSKWPNTVNRRYQQMNIQQVEKKREESKDSYCDQLQTVKCETMSNADEENIDQALDNENDEYPQDYSLRDHNKNEIDEHLHENDAIDEQDKHGIEVNNIPELRFLNESGMQNGLPNHIYAQNITLTNQPRNVHVINTSTLVHQNDDNVEYRSTPIQPSDLSTHPAELEVSSAQPDNLSIIKPHSLSARTSLPLDITFTQINNKVSHHIMTAPSHILPNTITTYSITKPDTSTVKLIETSSNNNNVASKPTFTAVQHNTQRHTNTNIDQPNVITIKKCNSAVTSNSTEEQPQNSQSTNDVSTTKPNVMENPRRASTATPNVRLDPNSTSRQTNTSRFRRRTLANRMRNNVGSFSNSDFNALIRNIVRDEVYSSSRSAGAVRDESTSYGEHVGFRLQRLSSRARSIVTHLIDGILYEADMGIYDIQNGSVPQRNHIEPDISVKIENQETNMA